MKEKEDAIIKGIIAGKEVRLTSQGKEYLSFHMIDKTGGIKISVFDDWERFSSLKAGDTFLIKSVRPYKYGDALQIKLQLFHTISETIPIDLNERPVLDIGSIKNSQNAYVDVKGIICSRFGQLTLLDKTGAVELSVNDSMLGLDSFTGKDELLEANDKINGIVVRCLGRMGRTNLWVMSISNQESSAELDNLLEEYERAVPRMKTEDTILKFNLLSTAEPKTRYLFAGIIICVGSSPDVLPSGDMCKRLTLCDDTRTQIEVSIFGKDNEKVKELVFEIGSVIQFSGTIRMYNGHYYLGTNIDQLKSSTTDLSELTTWWETVDKDTIIDSLAPAAIVKSIEEAACADA